MRSQSNRVRVRRVQLSPSSISSLVLHVSPPTYRRSPSLPHERLFPIRDQVPLLITLCGSRKPIVPRGAPRARPLASWHRSRPPLSCSEGLLLCILYVFLYLLLLQTSCSLFQDSLFYFGPFVTVFRTRYLLHPCHLYVRRSAPDHISVNLSLFRAPHSLAIVAARVCRRQAGLYIWF